MWPAVLGWAPIPWLGAQPRLGFLPKRDSGSAYGTWGPSGAAGSGLGPRSTHESWRRNGPAWEIPAISATKRAIRHELGGEEWAGPAAEASSCHAACPVLVTERSPAAGASGAATGAGTSVESGTRSQPGRRTGPNRHASALGSLRAENRDSPRTGRAPVPRCGRGTTMIDATQFAPAVCEGA